MAATIVKKQRVWVFDAHALAAGVHADKATLYRLEDGKHQWETAYEPAMFYASEDGTLLEHSDAGVWIFFSPQDAAEACIERLRKRITDDWAAIESIGQRYLLTGQKVEA